MPAKIAIENISANEYSDLDQCYLFSVENVGEVDAQVSIEVGGVSALLPVGVTREFPYVGAHYTGRLYVRFLGADGLRHVTIVKVFRNCK